MENKEAAIKVSIIIPVYNAEAYIHRCIESLKAQTLKELEFIFVDDCSRDEGIRQAEQWASNDTRVRILKNEVNLGEGSSRNRGIKSARGLYVNTIDPDDWVASDYYELLYAKAVESNAGIVKGTRIKVSEKTFKEIKPRSKLNKNITTGLSRGEPLFLHLHYEHQTIIFKKDILDEKTEYGKSGNAADTTFLLKLCSQDVSFAVENRAHYYYLQRMSSATGEYTLKRSKNEVISLEEMISHFLQEKELDEYMYRYCANRFYSFSTRFIHCCEVRQISRPEKEQFVSDFRAQFLRLPSYERLYANDLRIFALIELNIVLCNGLYNAPAICRDQVADWIVYIMALDGNNRKAAGKRLESMMVTYVKKRKRSGASLRVITNEILQVGSGCKWIRHKIKYYEIIARAFINNFPKYRKRIIKWF